MSVSIKLSPAARVFRFMMGKQGFDNWIASMEVVRETNFESSRELMAIVKKCGYNVAQHGETFKTSYGFGSYLLWENRHGKWVAIFNNTDDQNKITGFMNELERKAKRKIFGSGQNTLEQTQTFPTNFKDFSRLQAVLDLNQIPFEEKGSEIHCDLDGKRIIFSQPAKNGVVAVQMAPDQHTYERLALLDEDYKAHLQEQTYQRLVERVQEKDFIIEQEEVLADNSIVLTVNVSR